MSRLDRKFTASEDEPTDAAEILAALEAQSALAAHERSDAIARYLAGEEGWRDACSRLGGAFAEPPESEELSDGKDREQ